VKSPGDAPYLRAAARFIVNLIFLISFSISSFRFNDSSESNLGLLIASSAFNSSLS
jgi:hypothetical protein